MANLVYAFIQDDSGSTAIEYGLIAALVAIVIIAALSFLGTHLASIFNLIGSNLTSAG